MKKVLNAIKKGFLGFIGWIKNTAWVQPLLIVGAIFGLIMSIKPISNWIGQITDVNTTYTFYDSRYVNLEELEAKIDATEEDTNKTLLVFYIREANDTCANCQTQEKYIQSFFNSDHSKYENARDYEIVVLDIASDEFLDEDEEVDYEIIKDHIEKYNLEYTFEEIQETNSAWISNGTIDVTADDPISTPCIARYEDGKCVGIKMGYTSEDIKDFERFCYYDPETNFKEEF